MDFSETFSRLCDAAKDSEDGKLIESLLVQVRDVNDTDEDGHTPLWYAAVRNPHLVIVEVLLSAGAVVSFDIVSEAVINNPNPEIPLLLFSHLSPVEKKDLDLLFILAAASNQQDVLVRYFLSKGANPNATMPMDLYLEPRDEDDADFDEMWMTDEQSVEQNALVLAMYENPDPVPMIKTLIELGVDPNAVDSEGYPVLIHALDNADLVKALLAGGANPHVIDSQGMTPLMHACAADVNDVALLLLETTTDVQLKSFTGETALHYALGCHLHDNVEVVKALIAAGCDVNEADGDGLLPLDIARFNFCSEEIIEILTEAGARMGEVS